jgi:hypothetical protein
MALYLVFVPTAAGGGPSLFLLALVVTAAFGAWLLWTTVRQPALDRRATPRPVLVGFAVFVAVLVLAGSLLVLRLPDILPWPVTPELSVVGGLIFLGAAVYFGYGLVRPGWTNAGGQLAGFLAYDLVLILPFLARLPGIPDKWRFSLVAYTAVLVVSGALAAWYLFISRETRLRPR